ncbi:pantetheine-phosphate adenylyltransferase [Paractinoplanes atraurantiacus]|uniref:Pantetheine-phosphate adenylyltransferase n=1 Tax=Paractinoplanes atraurantiacus TaxID=1036182 RepID=A0A285IUC5_9ACTN|nr:pantetheine-phosphate adenylyltransferase [Actinoplanes atraurantiacus]SNY50541.1 Phosphopantetheine adenylyltransferase [Actinoplanes atraurantiacus]
MLRAVYPGTFDPLTPGHLDIAGRAREVADHLTLLVAVNSAKHPARAEAERAAAVRAALPPYWENVLVVPWAGLTATFCREHDIDVIIRGVRNATDIRHEQELAAMNESLGVTTLLMAARPELATVSSTAARALGV